MFEGVLFEVEDMKLTNVGVNVINVNEVSSVSIWLSRTKAMLVEQVYIFWLMVVPGFTIW